jgi:hypothetical protein
LVPGRQFGIRPLPRQDGAVAGFEDHQPVIPPAIHAALVSLEQRGIAERHDTSNIAEHAACVFIRALEASAGASSRSDSIGPWTIQ